MVGTKIGFGFLKSDSESQNHSTPP